MWKGPDLAATHKVQSHRGIIERVFAALKKFLVLQGGDLGDIAVREMELDVVMALHNLKERSRQGLMATIPDRGPKAPHSHIITRDLEPDLKIPKEVLLEGANFPRHLTAFRSALTSLVPLIKESMDVKNGECLFTNRVLDRGANLLAGGNVLQVAVLDAGDDIWWVRASVGASMKNVTYKCLVQLQNHVGLINCCGECKNGYVAWAYAYLFCAVFGRAYWFRVHRNKFCAHVCATLLLLVKWIEAPDSLTLVQKCYFEYILLSYFTSLLKFVRKKKLVKPDTVLRFFPLEKVLPSVEKVSRRLLFHPQPIRHVAKRQACFCKKASDAWMLRCGQCHERFHKSCVGAHALDGQDEKNWRCGFCLGDVDGEGNRVWILKRLKKNKVEVEVVKSRNDMASPSAKGIDTEGADEEAVGPSTWKELVLEAEIGGMKTNRKLKELRDKAGKAMKEAGHHVVDEMIGGGVGPRVVNDRLADELLHNGFIEEN